VRVCVGCLCVTFVAGTLLCCSLLLLLSYNAQDGQGKLRRYSRTELLVSARPLLFPAGLLASPVWAFLFGHLASLLLPIVYKPCLSCPDPCCLILQTLAVLLRPLSFPLPPGTHRPLGQPSEL